MTPITVSRWSRAATAVTVLAALAVLFLAAIPYTIGGPAEQPLITLLTFVAMASLWNLLAGFSGLTSFGQHAYLGRHLVAQRRRNDRGQRPRPGRLQPRCCARR